MKTGKNVLPYGIAAAVFLLLKAVHSFMDNNDLLFLLLPTNTIVEVFTGSQAQYITQEGFCHKSLNMIIDKSCSGFNFMLICYVVLIYACYSHYRGRRWRYALNPLILVFSWVLTIAVNASRILSALYLGKLYPASKTTPWMHESLGVLIYLSFLILFYLLIGVILAKPNHQNEKPV